MIQYFSWIALKPQLQLERNPMGLNKDFFTKPILVPCTLSKTIVNENGDVSTTEEKMLFSLRREKQGEADSLAKEAILNTVPEREIRLARFCGLNLPGSMTFRAMSDHLTSARMHTSTMTASMY
jgi:hypothetical protein